jgi:hypothetical protein
MSQADVHNWMTSAWGWAGKGGDGSGTGQIIRIESIRFYDSIEQIIQLFLQPKSRDAYTQGETHEHHQTQ